MEDDLSTSGILSQLCKGEWKILSCQFAGTVLRTIKNKLKKHKSSELEIYIVSEIGGEQQRERVGEGNSNDNKI